jgi:hypothetical protein
MQRAFLAYRKVLADTLIYRRLAEFAAAAANKIQSFLPRGSAGG